MTLREELEVVAHHLREVSGEIAALREQTSQLQRSAEAGDASPLGST
jgi:hypothetical protein